MFCCLLISLSTELQPPLLRSDRRPAGKWHYLTDTGRSRSRYAGMTQNRRPEQTSRRGMMKGWELIYPFLIVTVTRFVWSLYIHTHTRGDEISIAIRTLLRSFTQCVCHGQTMRKRAIPYPNQIARAAADRCSSTSSHGVGRTPQPPCVCVCCYFKTPHTLLFGCLQ